MSTAGPGPNPQTNLILSIVAPVIALIAIAVLWFTKPVVQAPAAPTAVNTAAAKLPDAGVSMATALPGGGSGAGAVGGSVGGPAAGRGMPPAGGGRPPSGGRGGAMPGGAGG